MPATETISVECPCGKRLKAPATAVGRKAKCPTCGNVLTVTAPPPKAKPQQRDDIDDALYDLAADASSAAAAAPPPVRNVCLNCQSPMASGAVLCTACGYDTRTGKSLSGAKAPAASKAPVAASPRGFPPSLQTKVKVEKPEPAGSMLMGAILSAVFATVGAFVWFAIAKATHREIGWIAWGVGIAAGFGMMLGYKGTSVASGGVAAMFAVGGILLGKWIVYCSLFGVATSLAGEISKAADQIPDDDKLRVYLINQQLEQKGLDPETAKATQRQAAGVEADKIIARMDAKTKAEQIKKARESFEQFHKRLAHDLEAAIGEDASFVKTMFDPMDLLFFVIAIASAFKVATFGGQAEGT
jgi:hypothetical protein